MGREISYSDALKILGEGKSKLLATIDTMLGGVILTATATTGHLDLLALLHARDELVEQSGKLLAGLAQRARGATGKSRTDLLIAAHAVVAVNAYFQALRALDLPIDVSKVELTPEDQLSLTSPQPQVAGRTLIDVLLSAPVPRPLPQRPHERVTKDMRSWYTIVSKCLLEFVSGLAVWDEMDATAQSRFSYSVSTHLPSEAVTLSRKVSAGLPRSPRSSFSGRISRTARQPGGTHPSSQPR